MNLNVLIVPGLLGILFLFLVLAFGWKWPQ
jgi:hypothetical protein